jgi:hypothetical protein
VDRVRDSIGDDVDVGSVHTWKGLSYVGCTRDGVTLVHSDGSIRWIRCQIHVETGGLMNNKPTLVRDLWDQTRVVSMMTINFGP